MSDTLAVEGRRFLSLLLLAEGKLLAGEYDSDLNAFVGEIRQLAAESDGAMLVMEESTDAALRFDAVVSAWKELRDTPVAEHRRCRSCPGALHLEVNCPFMWQ